MSDTINIILVATAGVFGAGWGVHFLYYRFERRRRAAEVKTTELDADAREDEIRNTKLINAYETIVKLQTIVDTERGRWVAISTELSEVRLLLHQERDARLIAEYDRCTVVTCDGRRPPREAKN